MLSDIREFFLGPPLPTKRLAHERLDNLRALAALSPDALSSIAYANQEIFLGLVVTGAAGLALAWPIAIAIAALLGVVAISYTQTIHAYPSGGGSYAVARENLGQLMGLIAAAALLIDYVLTAAVSLTAGVAEIASAFPVLLPYRVALALIMLALVTVANLRGVHETGTLMSIPIYLFVLSYLGMLGYGVVRALLEGPASFAQTAPPPSAEITTFIILHTFASGCTALTGVEAISNGVPIFRPPETHNASRVMIVMAVLMGVLFLGSNALTQYFGVVGSPGEETILSALARRILGSGLLYYVVQVSTLLVLLVAANTSFAGFPRLASILAQDSYLPRQLSFLGDRLVFGNGMLLLAGVTAALIVLFGGDTHALIPLFAVGVFIAFTLSQAGMVIHWFKDRGRWWPVKALVNGVGMLATLVTLGVVTYSKFREGAGIVVILIPVLVLTFRGVHNHYKEIREQLTLHAGLPPDLKPLPDPRVIVPISGVHRGVINALRYAASISKNVTAVYIEVEPAATQRVLDYWDRWGLQDDAKLVVIPSPYRSIIEPFLEYLDQADEEANDGQLASVMLPEFVLVHWWEFLLHNQTAWVIRLALLYGRRRYGKIRAIIDIPMYLRD